MIKLLSRLPILATLITFVAVVIMFALGMWQLQRAEEKNLRLLSIKKASQTEQISLQTALLNIDGMIDMPINFDAQADVTRYFMLDNKIHNGRVGYQVLLPLKTSSGLLLANLGWLPATNSRDVLPRVTLDGKQMPYTGVVSFPSDNAMVKETAVIDENWPKLVQQIDFAVIEAMYNARFLPLVVQLDDDPSSGFVRNWKAVVMAPEKHIAYGVQWFLLAFAAIVVFVIAQRKKIKRNNGDNH
jgi:cytochrome oxidase assembly protein ShyY1